MASIAIVFALEILLFLMFAILKLENVFIDPLDAVKAMPIILLLAGSGPW